MDTQFEKRKQGRGLLFGSIAGFAFAVMAWGMDALQLAQAHVAWPLAKFLPGLVLCMLAGGLAGWLSMRLGKVWAAILLWLALAGFFTWLVMWLQLQFSPRLFAIFDPRIGDLIFYPALDREIQYWAFTFVVVAFVSILCGLLEIHLIDQSMLGQGSLALLSPLLISLALFGFAGVSADDLVTKNFRTPILAMDKLIQFAIDNEGKELPPVVVRQQRLSVVKDLYGVIDRPRSLILTGYDRTLGQMEILVDFSGKWVRCTVIYNQPTMCKISGLPPDQLRFAGI